MVEKIPLMEPYKRVTTRLATYILSLCKYMTMKEVAEHLGLNWKTVKIFINAILRRSSPKRTEENQRFFW